MLPNKKKNYQTYCLTFQINKMKKISFLLFWTVLMTSPLFAKTLRLNNSPGSNAPYSTFAAAQAAALNGDTIIVEPSATSYGIVQITIQLTIVGNGYLHTNAIQLQENSNNSAFEQIYCFVPCTFYGLVSEFLIVYSSNVTVSRCFMFDVTSYNSYSNTIISQNYLRSINIVGQNLQITNNIIKNSIYINPNSTAVVENNVIGFDVSDNLLNLYGMDFNDAFVIFRNNILIRNLQVTGASNVTFDNNLASGAPFPVLTSNFNNVDMTTVFIAPPYSDNYYFNNYGEYSLSPLPGGPADNTGYYGDDIGIFNDGVGRPTYHLKGIPPFPTIYYLSTGVVSGNTLPVTILTRANN